MSSQLKLRELSSLSLKMTNSMKDETHRPLINRRHSSLSHKKFAYQPNEQDEHQS